jgi:regulator of PEP synthase PpsR (kinase-PPPase family)
MNLKQIHLVSDSTGETVSCITRACLAQFENANPTEHLWWLVRTPGQVERVISGIEAHKGLVLFTLVDTELRKLLEEGCKKLKVPCISVLDPVMLALSSYLKANIAAQPGLQHVLDAEYFERIDAMQYTLAHDDGQLLEGLDDADVIVVGISRTSKTPTCMYMANRGIKAANIPLVPDIPLPQELFATKRPLIVGLTKDPASLAEIRKSRLRYLNEKDDTDYADFEAVKAEVTLARRIFSRNGWPVIDVSRRSIEEAAAAIMQLHQDREAAKSAS